MIFDPSQRLALAVIREVANLIEPDTGQDECAIATFAFDLTLSQVRCLNEALKERFEGLFAILVQVVLPRASLLRQLLRGEDPSAGLFVEIREEAAAKGLVPEPHVSHFEVAGLQRLDGDVGFVLVVRTPGGEDRDGMWE